MPDHTGAARPPEVIVDEALVDRARAGGSDAFAELVRRHTPRVYTLTMRLLGNRADAEDAAQEAFTRAWLALPGYREDAAFGTWLYRITTNVCLKTLSRRRPTLPLDAVAEPAHDRSPEHDVTERARGEALRIAIARLPSEQRIPLVLREFAGCSYESISAELGLTVPAVRGRLHRARLTLLEAMRPWT
ncbi:MAG: sigma-70 family RNA polymerase sigma factor [Dactylosporangium sp.]|nr:sigma-70 family RNA polymerase sigma factor [Dactylosporangium sp.]